MKKYPYLRVLRHPRPLGMYGFIHLFGQQQRGPYQQDCGKDSRGVGRQVDLDGEVRHTFPTPEMVIKAEVGPLTELRLGLDRHSKIIAAAKRIRDGKLDLSYLAQPQVSYSEAKRTLMGCHGIGHKIADCITLFGLDKVEAFPRDMWVTRALGGYFPNQKHLVGDKLAMWAQNYFGKYAGYANQLLFQEQRALENRRLGNEAGGN